MSKIISITSGGDWADASVDYIVLYNDLAMEEANKLYRKWYDEVFNPDRGNVKYLTLSKWLIEKGFARKTYEEELEEYHEF